MKYRITRLPVFIFFILSVFYLRAQTDPNIGFYVDGVKVNEISCYSFNTLTFVLPYNATYNQFPQFTIEAKVDGQKHKENWAHYYGYADFSKAELTTSLLKGKYIVYHFFIAESQYCKRDRDNASYDNGTRGFMYYHWKEDQAEATMHVELFDLTVSGYEEKYDEECQCVKKTPTYSSTKLGEELSIPLKNRKAIGVYGGYPREKKVELAPCNIPGAKTDFKNLK